jgi:hypothetical protein
MIYYLYTSTVKRSGTPVLLTRDELVGRYGFRSVFGYPESTAATIERQGNTRNLQYVQLYIDELLIDFDERPADAARLGQYLKDNNIAHRMYDSGNRSVHYHISLEPRTERTVVFDARHWVQRFAPGADMSIYSPSGLFRLEGTWHEKNPGHRKELVSHHDGSLLALPKTERPRKPETRLSLKQAEAKFFRGLGKRQEAGGRNQYVWYLGKKAADSGMDAGDALERIVRWNAKYCNPPLDIDTLVTKVREAYDE